MSQKNAWNIQPFAILAPVLLLIFYGFFRLSFKKSFRNPFFFLSWLKSQSLVRHGNPFSLYLSVLPDPLCILPTYPQCADSSEDAKSSAVYYTLEIMKEIIILQKGWLFCVCRCVAKFVLFFAFSFQVLSLYRNIIDEVICYFPKYLR